MATNGAIHGNGQQFKFLTALAITTAVTGVVVLPTGLFNELVGLKYVALYSVFTYGSGGTTAKFWLQTTFDNGATWCDIANHAFTTASLNKVSACCAYIAPASQGATSTDATLADNTINQGTLGSMLRLKYTTTGTYAGGTTVSVSAVAKG